MERTEIFKVSNFGRIFVLLPWRVLWLGCWNRTPFVHRPAVPGPFLVSFVPLQSAGDDGAQDFACFNLCQIWVGMRLIVKSWYLKTESNNSSFKDNKSSISTSETPLTEKTRKASAVWTKILPYICVLGYHKIDLLSSRCQPWDLIQHWHLRSRG